MGRTVKKLSGLEIDEVSLVDRPANQHGLVAIAKNHQEDKMDDEIFDAEGQPVDQDELEHGDVVYDGEGNEFIFVEGAVEDERELESAEVGKGLFPLSGAKVKAAGRLGRMKAKEGLEQAKNSDAGQHLLRNKHKYGYGATAAGGAATGYGLSKRADSLGAAVFSELSKALTDSDRDEVIAKAMGYVDEIAKRNEALEDVVAQLVAEREAEDYVELAKGYELPEAPEGIGGLLYRAAQVLPVEDVQLLDRLFTASGEIAKGAGVQEQIGYDGFAESDILSQVYAVAGEVVAKGDGALTQEAAVTALFTANPAAYDEYEAEQRRQR